MNPANESAPFLISAPDVPDFRIAVAEIARTGYTETAVRERLGLADITDLKWKALPIYRDEHLAGRDAQALAELVETGQTPKRVAQDHARMLAELKREVGRLVVQTTATVTGKVLTPDDQRRLSEETQKQIA